jgi:hypothetical protein
MMSHSSPVSSSGKKRRVASQVAASTRLLPLPDEVVSALLIDYHMALASLRQGRGDLHHFVTMARVVVVSCHLFDAGYGEAHIDGLMEVHEALDRSHRMAAQTGNWCVDDATFELLADLLTLHEQQLREAPFHVVARSNEKMEQGVSMSGARASGMRTAA